MTHFTLLDGPMGSELTRRGADTSLPLWSARALRDAPDLVEAIHRDYARLGAHVHRANTFRARRRTAGDAWQSLAREAVARAQAAALAGQRVAGSVGPLEDCYRPDLAPLDGEARPEHEELARFLAGAGVDFLMCETFPSPREACVAAEACAKTGMETWVSLTAGPNGELMTPEALGAAARACVAAGASAVLVNCVAAALTAPYVEALAEAGVPFGAYANASRWNEPPLDPDAYAAHARAWLSRGATILGACCGTGPAHVARLAQLI
jgi:S-methylmethionine-dependent homocysteine/selenocysteine methylase